MKDYELERKNTGDYSWEDEKDMNNETGAQ